MNSTISYSSNFIGPSKRRIIEQVFRMSHLKQCLKFVFHNIFDCGTETFGSQSLFNAGFDSGSTKE